MSLDQFNSAVKFLNENAIDVSDTDKLFLYARFKQATLGDNFQETPSFWKPRKRLKWDSWKELSGMSRMDARADYVEKVTALVHPTTWKNVVWNRK